MQNKPIDDICTSSIGDGLLSATDFARILPPAVKRETTNYLNPRYLLKLFDKLLAEAGLSHMRFHDLRHSVVTLLLGMGVDPRTIQEFVGHEDITITLRIYSHVLPSMQQGVADKLSELFNQGL